MALHPLVLENLKSVLTDLCIMKVKAEFDFVGGILTLLLVVCGINNFAHSSSTAGLIFTTAIFTSELIFCSISW
jgi:hypothetical protein